MSLCIHDYIVSGSGKWQIAIGCAVCKRGKVELREPARPPIMRKVSFSQCCRENSILRLTAGVPANSCVTATIQLPAPEFGSDP